ncbi:MAG: cell division/cell wall cluster transcriptional repressor MraZ [Candidatus Andersenbacteria bacterium RIFCSPHIGHO2_12_FULL_45_11b]|uniref:Transcriptional regulator MraZ n=1 Tax=Candidatus Andersenbacteria bacterium RIFCSPHIGHO2_12_FULL_45_11b TaxID=1797282 RepID=A0A1G1XA80_9BACT|nr:MAG: cell division/cell wall cluster transcriptional repressor MraZ [Candidatus Andersenbacteria bacterium RIFCSPHIGHO2_12_FULL_45_11b]
MFIGQYNHTIDEKGRMSIPAKYRRDLQQGVVVTRGLDHCLFVYPKSEWEVMAEKLSRLPVSQKKSRAFARLMLAGAMDADLDGQGRVMLPEYLRQYASVKKHVIVAGLYNRLEIWDEDAWREYRTKTELESDDIAESMNDLDI